MKSNALFRHIVLLHALLAAVAALAEPPPLSDLILLPGDAAIGPAAGWQQDPAVARGGDQSLVVWVDGRTDVHGIANFGSGPYQELDLGSLWDIYAARVDAQGAIIDTTPIVVTQEPHNQHQTVVAWNGSHWLVVWSGQALGTFGNRVVNIYAARVAPDGTVLDPTPITIDTTEPLDDLLWPSVGSDGTNWLVVWRDLDQDQGIWVLDGTRVGPDGTVLDPGGVPIRHPATNVFPSDPDIAFLDGHYLVIWNEGIQLRGQRFDPDVQPVGSDFRINPTAPGGNADVTTDGTQFFVVWADGSIPGYDVVRGARVSAAGAVVQTGIAVTPLSGFGCYAPAATWDGGAFVVTYERGLTVPVNLRAARVSAEGQVLANEILVASGADHSEYSELAPLPGGGALAVWQDDRDDRGDIYGAVIDAAGSVGDLMPVSLGTPRQTRGEAVPTDAGHLLVYLSETAPFNRVLVHRLDAQGNPLPGEPVEVFSGGHEIVRPAIGSVGSHALVVWENAAENQIYGKRLLADGSVVDDDPIAIVPGNTPDAAGVGDRFLVISSHEPINHIRYPTVARVDALTGAVMDTPFTIGSSYTVEPHVVGLADRWLCVWERNPTHDNPTPFGEAAFVDYAGDAAPDFDISAGTQPLPTAAAAPDTALFAFPEGDTGNPLDMHARRILSGGSFLDPGDLLVAGEPRFQRNPGAAWNGTVFLTTWVDSRADTDELAQMRGDLFAARVTSDGAVLDPGGFTVANEPYPEMQPFAGGAGGLGILGGSIFREEAPHASLRIGYRLTSPPVTAAPDDVPAVTRLLDARPNPFNPRTVVAFDLAHAADVRLSIYDPRGRRVRSLHQGTLPAGRHEMVWNGQDDHGRALGSGVYLFRLEGAGASRTGRCTLVR